MAEDGKMGTSDLFLHCPEDKAPRANVGFRSQIPEGGYAKATIPKWSTEEVTVGMKRRALPMAGLEGVTPRRAARARGCSRVGTSSTVLSRLSADSTVLRLPTRGFASRCSA